MTDHHIHIGQFNEIFYNPQEILQTLIECGVESCLYSSTSSCIYNIKYQEIEKEIEDTIKQFSADKMQPQLWYIPDYIKQEITIEKAFENLPYTGIKLHPRANFWNLNDKKNLDCLHSLFDFADTNKLPILIHTGEDDCEKPNYFEKFFKQYSKAKIILAHCRPAKETIEIFRKYSNIKGDTAFLSSENYKQIKNAGFAERLLFGTDFPITYYFNKGKSTLLEQYQSDIELLK